ncbi:MAG: gamma-glutamyl-gamma-aminobutyrate hydrolase family protein [Nanoarchaeota archaeon]|nr:gamma-glutamyl-gamma-aminobutyrate hydrolase family protein [Nanoarchaeota archaeon]
MILIISLCNERLHENEFVKPVEKIVKISFFTKRYKDVKEGDLKKADKVIICGTSLQDFEYTQNLELFSWIKEFKKPILGICAGMQVIGLTYGGKLIDEKYVGTHFSNFTPEFVNKFFEESESLQEVYYLHNKIVTLPKEFIKLNETLSYPTAFKHKSKEIYGVLFHPEVLNIGLIKNFVKN